MLTVWRAAVTIGLAWLVWVTIQLELYDIPAWWKLIHS